ncbi:hypothetical protein HN789_03010 [archaeon]|jgi:antitoxin component of MazEF toxin-antitoxin module|nr:hypothetical protein [archaeon]MBT4023226.1 hypothetical protein [archaeon]MBT4271896.1 hypothetical protein [archaeon]MBT4460995.1 hypothetical protein [archaeon]MBT4858429.1 hypothetical protein [archaeon]
MKRKLLELGGSVFVSLPSIYVKSNNLKKGQEIELEIIDNSVIISSTPIIKESKRNIDISNNHKIGKRYVTALYRKGIDDISLNFEGMKSLLAVKKLIETDTIGYEIIKQDKDNINIKDFSVKSTEEYNNIIRRIWLILLENSKELLNAAKTNDFVAMQLVRLRDKDINKFSNFCCRLVFKGSLSSFSQSVISYNFLRNLEAMSDSYKELSIYLREEEINLSEQSYRYFEETINILEEYYNIFYKFNLSKLNDCVLKIRVIEKKIKLNINKNKSVRESLYIMSILKKLDEIASNLVELN